MSGLPAQSLDAEESVLGACLMSAGAVDVCSEILVPEAFYRPSHGIIFRAILDVADKGEPVDALTVVGRLDADGRLADAGGMERIHELGALVPAASNAAHYAKIVRAMWLRREIARVGHELVALGDNGAESVTDLLAEADRKLLAITQASHGDKASKVFTGREVVEEYRHRLAAGDEADLGGVATPYSFLPPLFPSRLYLLAGYEKDGKTMGFTQFLRSACEGGARVGFGSAEMSRADMVERLLATFGIPYPQIKSKNVDPALRSILEEAMKQVESWDWEIIDDEDLDSSSLRRHQRRGKYDFLIFDHFHEIKTKDLRHERQEMERHALAFAHIAREFDIPVLLGAQISRTGSYSDPYPRPHPKMLKGTSKLEQVASHIWFIYRKRDENKARLNEAEFIIAASRYGDEGSEPLILQPRYMRFVEAATYA